MENNFEATYQPEKKQEHALGGIIGAILGALAGAVLWCLVAIFTEHIYAMIGFVVGLIVGFGYDLFKGRTGVLRMVTVLVCVILSVVAGTVGAYAWWLHEGYVEETEFIATASKQELAEAYLTAEELEELKSYPTAMQNLMLESLEVTMPSEMEYYQLALETPEFVSELTGECGSSIFFALLGSFALILGGGKKEKATANDVEAAAVSVDAAAVNLEQAAVNQEAAAPESETEAQA